MLCATCRQGIIAENNGRISYREAVTEAATMHGNLATQYRLLTDEPEMEAAHRNKAAALTELAALIEEIEQYRGAGFNGTWLLQRVAAGFDPAASIPGTGGG
jgi:hypothetical protein